MARKKKKIKLRMLVDDDGQSYFERPNLSSKRTYLAGSVSLNDLSQWQDDAKNNKKYLEECDFIGKVLANS